MHGILHLERRHDRAGREHIELQPSAGHLFDFLGVVDGEFMKNIARRPRRLEPPDRCLRARHLRHRHREARGQQQPAARQRCSSGDSVGHTYLYRQSVARQKLSLHAPSAGALMSDCAGQPP
jgi:hypothetical protein